MRRAVRTAIMVLLASIAAENARAASDEYASIHTIAVISAIGDEVETTTLGFTKFGTSDYDLRANWSLDQEAAAAAGKLLASHFTVRTVAVDPQLFADIKHGAFDNFFHDVGRRVAALPKNNGVDAYVVIFPDFTAQVGDQNHALVITRDSGSSGNTIAATSYLVGVFDAATGDRIDYGSAQYPMSASLYGHATPIATCQNAMWGEDPNQLGGDRQAQMRQVFAWLIDKDLGYALASANLIPKGDADTAATESAVSPNPGCREGPP